MKLLLRLIYYLFVLSFPFWLIMAGTSVMIFDTQESTNHTLTKLLFFSIWVYPIPVLIGLKLFNNNYKNDSPKKCFYNLCICFIGPIFLIISISLISIFNNGKF